MTLYEAAHKMGVETHIYKGGWPRGDEPFRPDLAIAHDLEQKLPLNTGWPAWDLHRDYGNNRWHWSWKASPDDRTFHGSGTFIEAVIALCERAP